MEDTKVSLIPYVSVSASLSLSMLFGDRKSVGGAFPPSLLPPRGEGKGKIGRKKEKVQPV